MVLLEVLVILLSVWYGFDEAGCVAISGLMIAIDPKLYSNINPHKIITLETAGRWTQNGNKYATRTGQMLSIDVNIDIVMSGRHLNEINTINTCHCARSIQSKQVYIAFSICHGFQ